MFYLFDCSTKSRSVVSVEVFANDGDDAFAQIEIKFGSDLLAIHSIEAANQAEQLAAENAAIEYLV